MVSRARRSRHAARKERQPDSAWAMRRSSYRAGHFWCTGVHCGGPAAAAVAWLQDLPDYTDASAYQRTRKRPSVYASDGTTLLAEFYVGEPRSDRAVRKWAIT